jgi:hypothetical protein
MSTVIDAKKSNLQFTLNQDPGHYGLLSWLKQPQPAVIPWAESGQKQSVPGRMLDVSEGVMEELGWDHVVASLQTDKGLKSVRGRVLNQCSCIDIQSGALDRWKIVLDDAGNAIRAAYDKLDPKEAIKIVSTIWEHLDRTGELAAARSRLLLGKLSKPNLGSLPEWFENQRTKLFKTDEDEIAADPYAVNSAELSVRAVVAACPQANDFGAEIETGPRNRVVIDWYMPKGRLQWMVEAMDIPWPAVKVYQVSQIPKTDGTKSMETRIMYNAFDAIDSFKEFLSSI